MKNQNNKTSTLHSRRRPTHMQILLFSLPCTLCITVAPLLAPTKAVAQSQESYTVQLGDTLSAIAASFHVSVQILEDVNHILDPNLIDVGEVLIIPSSGISKELSFPVPTGWEASHAQVSTQQTLGQAITHYLRDRSDQVSVAVWNLTTGHHFYFQPNQEYATASIVKVAIMATLLHRETIAHKPLTADEQSLMEGMIEYSNNDDATALWNDAGQAAGIQAFSKVAGLHNTVANVLGFWGLTMTSAADQITLLHLLEGSNSLIGSAERTYARYLMEHVVTWEDWGISEGPPATATVALKNGWLPINDNNQNWAINSEGYVQGDGRNYLIAVLSDDNQSEGYGITSIEHISHMVWQAL